MATGGAAIIAFIAVAYDIVLVLQINLIKAS